MVGINKFHNKPYYGESARRWWVYSVVDLFLWLAQSHSKHKSWELLSHLKSFVEGPWLCIGDFNAILQSSEKLSKRPAQVNQIDAFRIVLEICQDRKSTRLNSSHNVASRMPSSA